MRPSANNAGRDFWLVLFINPCITFSLLCCLFSSFTCSILRRFRRTFFRSSLFHSLSCLLYKTNSHYSCGAFFARVIRPKSREVPCSGLESIVILSLLILYSSLFLSPPLGLLTNSSTLLMSVFPLLPGSGDLDVAFANGTGRMRHRHYSVYL